MGYNTHTRVSLGWEPQKPPVSPKASYTVRCRGQFSSKSSQNTPHSSPVRGVFCGFKLLFIIFCLMHRNDVRNITLYWTASQRHSTVWYISIIWSTYSWLADGYHRKTDTWNNLTIRTDFMWMTSHHHHGPLNHQQLDCLFNSLFMLTTKSIPKSHITSSANLSVTLCRASNVENVSMI